MSKKPKQPKQNPPKYEDLSYPNVGGPLRYERGDGSVVTLSIDRAQVKPKPVPPRPAVTNHADGSKTVHTKASTTVKLPPGVKIRVNPQARLETLGEAKAVKAVAQVPGKMAALLPPDQSLFEHPDVGGKFTICGLMYGPEIYYDLHRRFLECLFATTPPERVDIRIGSNALNPKSLAMVERYVQEGRISKHYRHVGNDFKYPVMREMFFDPSHPIDTKWVMWFDDDSICERDPNWLATLSRHIIQTHRKKNAHVYGSKMTLAPNAKQWEILRRAHWHHGKPPRLKGGQPSPSGTFIHFPVGGWWCASYAAIVAADVPDLGTGLTHNGGDWQIGEQFWQAGYEVTQFNGQKQFIHTSSVERRGVTMPGIDKPGGAPIYHDPLPDAAVPKPIVLQPTFDDGPSIIEL